MDINLKVFMERLEVDIINEAIKKSGYDLKKAAPMLHLTYNALSNRVRRNNKDLKAPQIKSKPRKRGEAKIPLTAGMTNVNGRYVLPVNLKTGELDRALKRKCRKCRKPLPISRYFNCSGCVKSLPDEPIYIYEEANFQGLSKAAAQVSGVGSGKGWKFGHGGVKPLSED